MLKQSAKPQTIKTTNPQTVELAGTIGSTSESFVGESRGRYALSTSASTTITNAQNLYPELWNRAPAGWQSGSDLVVPAQNNLEYTENIELNLNDGDLTDAGTEILDLNFFNLKGFRKGKSISISFELGFDCTASGANGFDSVNIPLSLFPFLSGLTGISGDGSFVSNVNGLIDGVNSPGVYRQVTGKIVISGSNLNCGFFGDFYSATNRVASGTMFFHFNEDGTTDTPYIHLYDSVAAGALGLPEATADVSGIVTRNQVTEAGRNYIINGAMEFNQRGPDSASATSRYVLDRWKANASGATILGSLVEVSNVPFSNYMRLVASTADDNWGWFQNIEHPKDFSNNTYTLSFEARSADGSVAGFDVEPSFVFGSDTNEILTSTSISLTTSFVKHTVTITAPDLSGKTIGDNDFFSIGFIQKLNQTGQFDLRKVKLEEGTVATKFTRAGGTYAGELALCQRYYEKSMRIDQAPGTNTDRGNLTMGTAITADRVLATATFKIEKRKVPTINIYAGNGTLGAVSNYNTNSGSLGTGFAAAIADTKSIPWIIDNNAGGSLVVGKGYGYGWTAEAEL